MSISSNRSTLAADHASAPNIVIIYADDQGYQDLGCFGSPNIKTPNIDSIAADGIRFTSFYSAYCVCSASRASLMTGCYQPRIGMRGVLPPHSNVGLNPEETTIAELLKPKGYATQMIGKWHLGDKPETLPTAQGFDHYYGLPYSNDMGGKKGWNTAPASLDKIWREKKWDAFNNDLLRDLTSIESPVNQTTLTDRYTDEAIKFIKAHSKQPFFLYFAHTMVHVPLFVSDERYEKDPKQAYRLAAEHIDASVGRVLKTLDELGVADNTLVIYTSDNGPWLPKKHHGGSALPLRDGKGTTYEGGMREPTVMRWPARIPKGKVCDEVVSTIDLLPTIAKLVGAELPNHPIDGLDVSALLADPAQPSPHRAAGFFYYKNNKVEAVRRGKWKLRMVGKVELYDLDADIKEAKNVASANPEVVAELKSLAARYDADLKAHRRGMWQAGAARRAKQQTAKLIAAKKPAANPRTRGAAGPLAPIKDDPKLPRVLLIGDSISIGYTVPVRKLLQGKANVHRPLTNCGPTTHGLLQLDQWLGHSKWDVIHFNWGLHDLKYIGPDRKLVDPSKGKQQVPIERYEKNLRKLVERLKKTGAKLIWCSTTPVPAGAEGRVAGDAVRYNAVAAKVMKDEGIEIDDLYAFAKPRLATIQKPKNVHYTPHGSQLLAEQVSKAIEAALK